MRRITVAAIAFVPLTLCLAVPAGAKELTRAQACDANHQCRTTTATRTLRALDDRAPVPPPTRAEPFHRVRLTITQPAGERFSFTVDYVPSLRRVRDQMPDTGEHLWSRPSPRAVRAFERLTRGLEPVPADELRGTMQRRTVAAAVIASSGAGDGSGGGSPRLRWPAAAIVLAGFAFAAWRRMPRRAPRSTVSTAR